MPEKGYGGARRVKKRHIGMLLIYGAILAGIIIAGLRLDRGNAPETLGSLEGRFDSEITLEIDGQTLHYRENEITNYLLIGMDRAELDSGAGQADFLLILSIDRRNRAITPVMIDRDTMAEVTTYGIFGNEAGSRTMQICLAQAYRGASVSGSENTARAVSRLLHGVRMDRCLSMDLGGIANLNDAVGGVTVTVRDDLTALDPVLQKGATVRLEGDLAEHFVRGRMTVADGTNASRMRRQQVYIEALAARIGELNDRDEDVFEAILESLSDHIESDVSANILLSEADAYSAYEWKPLRTLSGAHSMGGDGFAEFWIDEENTANLVAEIWFA